MAELRNRADHLQQENDRLRAGLEEDRGENARGSSHPAPSIRAGNWAGRAGLGRANSGLDQNQAGPKLARFFLAKILVAQPALKIRLVGPNSLLKAKKIRADRARSGHTGPGHIGQGQIWHSFFRANNLMAQPDPNSRWTRLAHRVGPILPPLPSIKWSPFCQAKVMQQRTMSYPLLALRYLKNNMEVESRKRPSCRSNRSVNGMHRRV